MTPSLLASTSFPGPGAGLFAGAARPGASLGWGRPWGSLPGVASARLLAGLARPVPVRDHGVAGCGAASRVAGGRDGGEPFYVEGCGCGGVCGGRGRRAASACAGAPGRFPGGASPGHAGTTAVRGELAELPEDVELPPGWNSPFSAQWMLRHGGPVTLPERDEGNFLTPRGDAESDESGGLTPRWTEGEEDQYCSCETPRLTLSEAVASERVPVLHGCTRYESLVRLAWQMLLDNEDLIAQAVRTFTGTDMSDTFHDMLNYEWSFGLDPVNLFCEDLGGISAISNTSRDYYNTVQVLGLDFLLVWQGRVVILDTTYLEQLRGLYSASTAAGGRLRRKGQVCPVVDLAATVLHELTHQADLAHNDTPDQNFASYLIENSTRYYLARRYCVLGWGCCNWVNADSSIGTSCLNFDCLVGDPSFASDTYRIDVTGGRHNACTGTGPCAS